MSIERKIKQRRRRKELRVKAKLKNNLELPRISVFRSLKQIYGQLIDDNKGQTLASVSSLDLKDKGSKKDIAKQVGQKLAEKAVQQGVKSARFDRGRFLYHGRIKAFAEGLRDSGLQI